MTPLKRFVCVFIYILFSLVWIPFCMCLGLVSELFDASAECAKAIREVWNER